MRLWFVFNIVMYRFDKIHLQLAKWELVWNSGMINIKKLASRLLAYDIVVISLAQMC